MKTKMDIHGIQKMTLLDYPGHVACTVFLAGCNFRCPFCHNSELLSKSQADVVMDDAGLIDFLSKRKGLLDGVAFTGGEPLITEELPEVMRKIREMGYAIKLDTNGSFPDRLEKILSEGLVDYVAMDIKNSPEMYGETAGIKNVSISEIEKSVRLLIDGETDYEFRTTVVNELHNEESFHGIGKLIKGAKRYFLQPFTDRDTVAFSGLSAPTDEKLAEYAEISRFYIQNVEIRGK